MFNRVKIMFLKEAGVLGRIYTFNTNIRKSRTILTSSKIYSQRDAEREDKQEKRMTIGSYFNSEQKNKEVYYEMIDLFKINNPNKRGFVEFIYAAMKHMKEFGVAYDLDTYKKLIEIVPKGKFVPENRIQVEMMHYPKQQFCIIELLDLMEIHGICPDVELRTMLKERFGSIGHPVRKAARMMYWMPKFKNASPWPVPLPPPSEPFALAKMAIERIMTVDPQSSVSVYQTSDLEEALDHTYIVNGQSPRQRELLAMHPKNSPIYVEGAFRIWLRFQCVNYFILRGDAKKREAVVRDPDDVSNLENPFINYRNPVPVLSVHEQDDGTIFAVCATGTSSRDSLLSWIRLLQRNGNPALSEIPVLFTLKSPLQDVIPMDNKPRPEEFERVSSE